jgi:hypothetical protein
MSRYGYSDLDSINRFWIFYHRFREKDYRCDFCLVCYVLDNGDLYSRLPSDIEQDVRLCFPVILVLVLLPMFIDYFNGCAHVFGLDIAA